MSSIENQERTICELTVKVETLTAELARERENTKSLTDALALIRSKPNSGSTYQRVTHFSKGNDKALCNASGSNLNLVSLEKNVTCRRCLGFLDRASEKSTNDNQ